MRAFEHLGLAASVALWLALVLAPRGAPPRDVAELALAGVLATAPLLALARAALERLLKRAGHVAPRAAVAHVLAPLGALPLALAAVPTEAAFLPLVVGLAVAMASCRRVADALPRPLPGPLAGRLALDALALVVLPGLLLFQTTTIHDAFQYQATAVSLLLDGDFDLWDELYLHNSTRSYNPHAEGSIRYLGVPLVEAPALAVAHAVTRSLAAARLSSHAANGFTLPYLYAVSLVSSAAGVAGVALTVRWVARRVGLRLALAATAIVVWASPLPFFTFLWHGWTHTYSVLGVALVLLGTDRLRDAGSRASLALPLSVGLAVGFLCLLWPLNGVVLLVPAIDPLARFGARRASRSERARAFAELAALGLGTVIGFLPQLAGWYAATGSWLTSSYGRVGDFFAWSSPALSGVLFSHELHGWLAWHPIYAVALVGLVCLRERRLAIALGAWVVLQTYALAAWSVWWTGIGFGNRFFLNLTPVAALGFAELWRRLRGDLATAGGPALLPRARRADTLVLSAAAVALAWNLSLLGAYRVDAIPAGIKGPEYVRDAPPTLGELTHALFVQAPADVETLTRDFWVNQTLVTSRLRLAAFEGDGEAAALALAFAVGVLLAWAVALRAAWPSSPGETTAHLGASARASATMRRDRAVAGLVVAWVAAASALLVTTDRSPAREAFFHVDAHERTLRPAQSARYAPAGYYRPTRTLDLVSFLTYAVIVPEGRPAATVRVQIEGRDAPEQHVLIVGRDTAEVGAERREVRSLRAHDAHAATPVHEWLTRAYSHRYYPAQAYHARIELEHPGRVEWIEIEMLHGAGDLVLRDLYLRES